MFCAAFEGLLKGDKALSLFFVLIEFTFSSIWTVQISEKVKFYRDKETSLSSLVTSKQSFKCSTEHLFLPSRLFHHTSLLDSLEYPLSFLWEGIHSNKQTKEGHVLGFLCAMISVLPKSERFLPIKDKYAAH